jgi:hypothetical protein
VDPEDFKSFCRALTTSEVGSIPTRSRHILKATVRMAIEVRLARRTVLIRVADDGFSRARRLLRSANRLRRWILARSCATGPAKGTPSESAKPMRVCGKRTTTKMAGIRFAAFIAAMASAAVSASAAEYHISFTSGKMCPPDGYDVQGLVLGGPGTVSVHRDSPQVSVGRNGTDPLVATERDTTASLGSWTGPSPGGAVLRSAVYPGWGQLANGKRFKACVVFGVEAYFVGVAVLSSRRAQDLLDQSRFVTSQEELAELERRHDDYINRRNAYIWWLGVAILYSMLDAYVDAILREVEESLSKPPPVFLESTAAENGSLRLGIGARF